MFEENKKSKAYIIGGGIASLSTAVYLIKDGKMKGENIIIFDESKNIGGSLDAQKDSSLGGYVMRGVRMFEEKAYTSTLDLMSKIPSLTSKNKTLKEEFVDFNKKNQTYSQSRLIKNGKAINTKPLGLGIKDRFYLLKLLFCSESNLENMEIKDFFTPPFFESNFWYEFCTVFSFQPWHGLIEFRRYFIRFIKDFPSIDTLETIEITPYNQYESLILPIVDWLKKQKVEFKTDTKVVDLSFDIKKDKKTVNHIYYFQDGEKKEIAIDKDDYVFITLGSMTADSSFGSMTKAPELNSQDKSASWNLWEKISKNNPNFGQPKVFNSHINKSKWISFTLTFKEPVFCDLIKKFINEKVNNFGGLSIVDSNWLMSVVVSYNPYFIDQPESINIAWGYGLYPDKEGNFVKKKMSECNGEEILTELIYHLGFENKKEKIIESAICIPCMMPYITSQFLPRKAGDRPDVVPKNFINMAFLGQYCEIPKDVVFTVEYSVRSAQIAVYSLLKLNKKSAPIYKGTHHIKVLYGALKTLFR